MTDFHQRWHDDWAALGLPADTACLDRLLAAYGESYGESHGESARHYHTAQHLAECLDLFAQHAHLARRPGEAAIALWFHDAVYVPLAKDNEARSAAWAASALTVAGAAPDVIARVQALVLATQHHAALDDPDTCLVVDIDLAILGAPPARFAEYERQVRAEYAAVPPDEYGRKRRDVLARFLARPAIYRTAALHARFEGQARSNLAHALAA